jgi:hypothetical protein
MSWREFEAWRPTPAVLRSDPMVGPETQEMLTCAKMVRRKCCTAKEGSDEFVKIFC